MRIAIVGSGIAGLACAHLLDAHHRVTLFEADDRLGGHTNTVTVDDPDAGPLRVDTGFIVHNDRNYPNLTRLFDQLGVATQPSEMSFSVSDADSGFTYRATNLATLLARPGNAVDRRLWRMLYDIARFYRNSRRFLADPDPSLTIDRVLARGRDSDTFIDLHLLPMGAAVWSTSPSRFGMFPATALLTFLENHGLLGIGDRPRWRTVVGGSSAYVEAMEKRFTGEIATGCPVESVTRTERDTVCISSGRGAEEFDVTILACHSDQARTLIANPTAAERSVLGAIDYEPNVAVLHTDTSVLSPARRAWAAWNYHAASGQTRASLTYDMTNLQRLPGRRRYLVTLNPERGFEPGHELARFHYAHPQFTTEAIEAQRQVDRIDGVDRLYFCGAYWGYGFHEDGLNSALRVCSKLGAQW
ncbi:MAG: NAD(P)/FAD-dependent oxidoreductase [Acidimicrobiales bacterium]